MVGRTPSGAVISEQVFRHCGPGHTDLDRTLEQAKAVGGRYNPAGEFGAVYVSQTREGAIRELDRQIEKLGIRRHDLLLRVLLILELQAKNVLDLTDERVREAWGTSIEELTRDDDYTHCHEVARSARQAGYEVIRFPAFDAGSVHFAVFLDRLRPGSRLQTVSEEVLGRG